MPAPSDGQTFGCLALVVLLNVLVIMVCRTPILAFPLKGGRDGIVISKMYCNCESAFFAAVAIPITSELTYERPLRMARSHRSSQ